jgi:hypothetical protein
MYVSVMIAAVASRIRTRTQLDFGGKKVHACLDEY